MAARFFELRPGKVSTTSPSMKRLNPSGKQQREVRSERNTVEARDTNFAVPAHSSASWILEAPPLCMFVGLRFMRQGSIVHGVQQMEQHDICAARNGCDHAHCPVGGSKYKLLGCLVRRGLCTHRLHYERSSLVAIHRASPMTYSHTFQAEPSLVTGIYLTGTTLAITTKSISAQREEIIAVVTNDAAADALDRSETGSVPVYGNLDQSWSDHSPNPSRSRVCLQK